ncbi:hypothetical protein ELY35_14030, partial [Escherichia coli]
MVRLIRFQISVFCRRWSRLAVNTAICLINLKPGKHLAPGFLCTENPQLGWGFRKAFSFKPVIKTPFDLLKHLAVWQLQVSNK